ncbi:MAG: class I SAM-dependent methyltransferase [Deltaproteobacteria bacterium]|nr:MAG: class I SAM-dependent methyltransferase [Deltaproteobacteria bacterium]
MREMEKAAAEEFDRWAAAGRDESMARGHRDVTEQAVADWDLGPGDRILDVGCGNGWAVRMLVDRVAGVPEGGPPSGPIGTGVDISPEMIARARAATRGDPRFRFVVAPGDRLPFDDGEFSHVLSVESLYYYPDPAAALREWRRVASDGARLAVVIELYRENPGSLLWVDALDIDVHVLGTRELVEMAQAAGWREVRARQVRDRSPVRSREEFTPSRYWPDYAAYLAYREAGALVVSARG